VQRSHRGANQAREIGQRIRRQREAVVPPLSQEQLADRAGLHRTYVGHVERGEVNLTVYRLLRLAAALDVDPAELVQGLQPDETPLGG
jgi:transcriptional regulator with XRE-family HTH domain